MKAESVLRNKAAHFLVAKKQLERQEGSRNRICPSKKTPCGTHPPTRPGLCTDHSAMETSAGEVSVLLLRSSFANTMARNQVLPGVTAHPNHHRAGMTFS